MARIARRRVLTLSASGGMAAILASGRAPALAQETDRPLAALGRFRAGLRRAAQGPDHAGMQEGDSASRSRSRPSTPTTCSRASPRRSSPAPARTSSWRSATGRSSTPRAWPTSATWPRRSARPQGGYYDVSRQIATVGNKWIGVPWTIGGGLIAYRKSWLEEAGYKTFPETWDDLPRGRQEAEGQGAADRPDRGPHVRRRAGLVVSLSCGRGAARRSRPTARPSC